MVSPSNTPLLLFLRLCVPELVPRISAGDETMAGDDMEYVELRSGVASESAVRAWREGLENTGARGACEASLEEYGAFAAEDEREEEDDDEDEVEGEEEVEAEEVDEEEEEEIEEEEEEEAEMAEEEEEEEDEEAIAEAAPVAVDGEMSGERRCIDATAAAAADAADAEAIAAALAKGGGGGITWFAIGCVEGGDCKLAPFWVLW
jgi:hypothetical protein